MATTFLLDKDYRPYVRDDIKQVLSQEDYNVQQEAVLTAVEEVKSYLAGTYDVDKIFISLLPFHPSTQYALGDYVYNTADVIYEALVDNPGGDLTVTTNWKAADPRNKMIVASVVAIALYRLYTHIMPNNIPDLRVKQYDDTIAWLNKVMKGQTNLQLPVIVGEERATFRLGGNQKVGGERW